MGTKFFTNQGQNTLLKKFEGIFKHTKVNNFDALVGYLRASGYFKINKHLKKVPKVRILVGINVDHVIKKFHKVGLEFSSNSEKILEEFKKDLKADIQNSSYNKETEEGITEFIKDVSSKKIEIAAHPTKMIHAKIYLFKPKPFNQHNSGSVISGSSNLSATGLGALPDSNYEFNVELRDYDDVNFASKEFEKLWKEAIDILPTDIVRENIKKIEEETYLNEQITPYELYYKLLIEYFGENVNFDPSSITDLPPGYKKLDYQADAVNEGFALLQKHRGFFLSDVVGTGKTIIATIIAKKLFHADHAKYGNINKTLVIAPRTIEKDWKKVLNEFRMPNWEFLPNRSFHRLKEPQYDPKSFDLIIVDEAHKFRSNTAASYNELQKLCKTPTSNRLEDGTLLEKKIILISASPLNNSPEDIKNEILLFQDGKNSTLEISNLDYFFNQKIKQYKILKKEKDKKIIKTGVAKIYGDIREKIISQIMIRRTRTDLMGIEQYRKNLEEQKVIFPKTGKPNKIFYKLSKNTEKIYDKTFITIANLNYAIYDEIKNLKPEAKLKYEVPEVAYAGLASIMKTLLIKRLDSSFTAFSQSLKNILIQLRSKAKQFENKKIYIAPGRTKLNIAEYVLEDREEELEEELLKNLDLGDIYKPDDFEKGYHERLLNDLDLVELLFKDWEKIDEDPKYDVFLENLKKTFFDKKINTGGKIVVFSEAKVTTDYLMNKLKKDGFNKILNIDAQNRPQLKITLSKEFDENFEPKEEKTNDYNILISTEVLAEGVNLHRSNVVINYDTPWNSTRLIQRIGRLNRIGTKADRIHVYNFFPTSNVEGDINLEQKAYLKLQSFHEALGEDSQIYHEAEETKTFGIFDKNIEEGKNEKLSHLMELRKLREENETYFRKLKAKSKRQRVGRKENELKKGTISFIRSERRNGFYFVNNKQKIEPLTFLETAKIFKANKTERSIALHSDHHKQVDKALKEFNKEQHEKAVENQTVDTKLGPQTKQALSFLDACSRVDFLDDLEKLTIESAKKAVRLAKFIELQREINRQKNSTKKAKLTINQTVDGLIKILKKYPIDSLESIDKSSIKNQVLNPEIIISESFN